MLLIIGFPPRLRCDSVTPLASCLIHSRTSERFLPYGRHSDLMELMPHANSCLFMSLPPSLCTVHTLIQIFRTWCFNVLQWSTNFSSHVSFFLLQSIPYISEKRILPKAKLWSCHLCDLKPSVTSNVPLT